MRTLPWMTAVLAIAIFGLLASLEAAPPENKKSKAEDDPFASDADAAPKKAAPRAAKPKRHVDADTDDVDPFAGPNAKPRKAAPDEPKQAETAKESAEKSSPGARAASAPPEPYRPGEAEKKLLEALKSPTECEFKETSLADVIDYFKTRHKIEIHTDEKALEEAGVALDSTVTKTLHRVSLRSALRLVLRDVGLTFILQDEVLLVTSPVAAANTVKVVVYDVTDLAIRQNDKGTWCDDASSMADAITSCIEPSSWTGAEANGVKGRAVIRVQMLPQKTVLVVLQSQECHEELEAFLSQARKIASTATKPLAEPPTEKDLLRRRDLKSTGTAKTWAIGLVGGATQAEPQKPEKKAK